MHRLLGVLVISLYATCAQAQQFFIQPPSTLGMNLSGVQEEMPLLNVLKTAGGWYTENSSNVDTTEETALYTSFADSNQYPTSLTTGGPCPGGPCPSHTFTQISAYPLLASAGSSAFPTGVYVLLYTAAQNVATAGTMAVTAVSGGASLITSCPTAGRCLVSIPSGRPRVTITTTDPTAIGNYINNVALIYSPDSTSGNVGVNETAFNAGSCMTAVNPGCFNPATITISNPFKTARMMDVGQTLVNQNQNWSDRSLPTWAFWATNNNNDARPVALQNGWPVEAMAAWCNAISANCWPNIPCMASTAYATSEATLLKSLLNPALKVYPEFCNEIWNNNALSTTIQTFMIAGGVAAYPTGATCPSNQGGPLSSNFGNMFAYGILQQVLDINIFKGILGSQVVRVLAGQASNVGRNQYIAAWQASNCGGNASLFSGTAAANADVLATAPYFQLIVGSTSGGGATASGLPLSWTADADGGLTKLFTEQNSGGLLPVSTVSGNCGNGAGETCGGTTAYTVTTGLSLPSTPANQTCVAVKFNSTIGASAALAADGGNAFPLANNLGTALSAGAIASGATQGFCLTSATAAGSVTAQWYECPLGTSLPGGYTGIAAYGEYWWSQDKITATSLSLGLVAYESGQNYVTGTNAAYQTWFFAAMADARMGATYTSYYTSLRSQSNGVINVFDDISGFASSGTWGILQNSLGSPQASPRYLASQYFVN